MFLTRRRNKRSNVNLSHAAPTTMGVGNLLPISFTRILTGDKMSFSPSAFLQAMPMQAPLVNGFKLCFEYFFIPDRLYNVHLNLNEGEVTNDPDTVEFPQMVLPSKSSFRSIMNSFDPVSQDGDHDERLVVQPGSLADYMGFPVGYYPSYTDKDDGRFSVVKMLGYLDVIYNYYVNMQIPNIPTAEYLHTRTYDSVSSASGELVDVVNGYQNQFEFIATIRDFLSLVKRYDEPRLALSQWYREQRGNGWDIDVEDPTLLGSWAWLCSRRSIFQRCMPPYYLESWLNTAGYNEAGISVDLDSDGNSISMRNISAMSHIQRWMDLAMGDGKYSGYLDNQFDVSSVRNSSVPLFLGSDRMMLGTNIIYQTTGFENSDSPLGAFAGQASNGTEFKRRSFKFGENGYFMVMASIVPDVIYTRGIDPFLRELNLADVYVPALDNIAMEPLKVEQLESLPDVTGYNNEGSSDYVTGLTEPPYLDLSLTNLSQASDLSVGFVPAWSKLMQNVSKAHGLLTTSLKYWLLSRDYSYTSIQDVPYKEDIRRLVEEGLSANYINENQARAILAFVENSYQNKYITPYVEAHRYNDVFADNSPYAENFILAWSCDMKVNREKSKVNVPTTI